MESTNIMIGTYDRWPRNVEEIETSQDMEIGQRQHRFDQLLFPILLSDFSHVKILIYGLMNTQTTALRMNPRKMCKLLVQMLQNFTLPSLLNTFGFMGYFAKSLEMCINNV